MTTTIEVVEAAVTAPLRQAVLRPHQSLDQMATSLHEAADVVHLAAWRGGEVVGAGSIRPEPPPWAPTAVGAWRIRGMATDPEHRDQGVGARLLVALVGHATSAGGSLVWCSARITAQSFYDRAGFAPIGEPWVDPDIGPHVHMWRAV